MIDDKKVIAIIPARGGSKRLANKNILQLAGKPLINWTIEAALSSTVIDNVVVSTDCKIISDIAQTAGANVPGLRPEELASDAATTESVLLYTLNEYANDESIVVLLQPTSPLRTSKHIDEAVTQYCSSNAKSVVSVTACEHSPLWSNTLPPNKDFTSFLKLANQSRSQDLDVFYRLNGAIYVFQRAWLQKFGLNYESDSYAFVMSNESSIDIDSQLDFDFADFLINKHTDN
ncbi:acylneuraminate cytidylyltransferase family protein [Vibrio splendidus]|jgi:CMP-N,N'-diacetyllegionaminic acid synthase